MFYRDIRWVLPPPPPPRPLNPSLVRRLNAFERLEAYLSKSGGLPVASEVGTTCECGSRCAGTYVLHLLVVLSITYAVLVVVAAPFTFAWWFWQVRRAKAVGFGQLARRFLCCCCCCRRQEEK
jgi:hypothetical protein